MHHFQALSDRDLETITGGEGDKQQAGSWLSSQWSNVKDSWSNAKDNVLGGIKQMMGPAGRYSGL